MTKGRVFVIADLHIGHAKCAEWRGFHCEDMFFLDLWDKWNKVVNPEDKVYILGDVCWKKEHVKWLNLLNGKKTIVAGNHDLLDTKLYLTPTHSKHHPDIGWFGNLQAPVKNIRGLKELTILGHTVWLSHAPIHEQAMRNKDDINIHGHLHGKRIVTPAVTMYDDESEFFMQSIRNVGDDRYINVCCEHTNNTPVLLEDLIRDRFGSKEPNPRV